MGRRKRNNCFYRGRGVVLLGDRWMDSGGGGLYGERKSVYDH
jgi:hypothetical protein